MSDLVPWIAKINENIDSLILLITESLLGSIDALGVLIVLVVVAGPLAASDSGLDTASYLAFVTALGTFLRAAVSIAHASATVAPVAGQALRVRPLLEAVPVSERDRIVPGQLRGRVSAVGVCYRYAEGSPWILDDVSIEANPGEFVAIVGASGSGKSTLVSLLLGAMRCERGGVYFDDVDLARLAPSAVRRQVGSVAQFGSLMPGSLYENIRGHCGCTVDEAWEAARAAGLAGDVEAMPMGMFTQITQGSAALSGGQVQRVLLARAIASRPAIMILDEATSALDEPIQRRVMSALDAMQVTRIVVAHRLSTIAHADRIYVIEGGRVVEQGRFADLEARGGAFARLAAAGA